MLGFLYLVIAIFSGSAICQWIFPDMAEWAQKDFKGEKIKFCPLFLMIPAWIYTGIIPMTWLVYLFSYLLREIDHGMLLANLMVMGVFLLGAVILYLARRARGKLTFLGMEKLSPTKGEIIFLVLIFYLCLRLFFTTFRISGGTLYVGLSVFSDFSPHLGMIRSFSGGTNFPTTYSHFAGEDIKYHFMFQFLVGNLEFLGMRLDLAFNIPSMLGMISTFLLLYAFATKLIHSRTAGYLAGFFFAFRSSFSVFRYLSERPQGQSVWSAFTTHSQFIGYTPNEDWGLWNLNVYCNQRHLAFTLGVLLFILILFTPHLYAMTKRMRLEWECVKEGEGRENQDSPEKEVSLEEEKDNAQIVRDMQIKRTEKSSGVKEIQITWIEKLKKEILPRAEFFFRRNLFAAEGWKFKEPGIAVFAGLMLGALSFWNGATTIAALLVLFIMATVSDHRLDFLVMAVITVGLAVLQSAAFIDGNAVSTSFYYGFIAEHRNVFGVLDYIFRLTGFALFVTVAAFIVADGEKRIITVAFAAPFLFAFHLSLTTDVTVNHKYIMISLMLFGILEAYLILRLWKQKKFLVRFAAVRISVFLSITGIFEYLVVLNRNQKQNNLAFDTEDTVTAWIRDNATAKDIFLTSNYALNNVVLGGAMLYDGWQYFGWSAGYDTAYRDIQVKRMYEAESSQELEELVNENRIRYIIVDFDNRTSEDYEVREDVIASTYEAAYTQGEDEWKFTIYDTQKLVR